MGLYLSGLKVYNWGVWSLGRGYGAPLIWDYYEFTRGYRDFCGMVACPEGRQELRQTMVPVKKRHI